MMMICPQYGKNWPKQPDRKLTVPSSNTLSMLTPGKASS